VPEGSRGPCFPRETGLGRDTVTRTLYPGHLTRRDFGPYTPCTQVEAEQALSLDRLVIVVRLLGRAREDGDLGVGETERPIDGRQRRRPGRPAKTAPLAIGKKARKKLPKQFCPVPGCKNPAAPVFGMVCAKHKDVPKAKIKKFREARKAKKLGIKPPKRVAKPAKTAKRRPKKTGPAPVAAPMAAAA
jgi:hypothetical protein